MPRYGYAAAALVGLSLCACASGTFRQVSFAGEAVADADSSGRTVHVVRNTEMTDTVLEQRIRSHIEQFLLQKGFVIASAETAELYFLATFGFGPRIVGSTAAVFKPAEVKVKTSSTGQVIGRAYTPDRMEYLRVPELQNSVWLMVLSSDARQYRETGTVRNLWRAEAAMRGNPESMGEAVPYLIVPALKFFGKGTRQTLLLDVREKDMAWKQ